jgi:hypothetical protein
MKLERLSRKNILIYLAAVVVLVGIIVGITYLYKNYASDVGDDTQPTSGGVWGQILDTSYNPVADVSVVVGDRIAITDSTGNYSLMGLNAGSYKLSFYLGGKSYIATNYTNPTINVVLGSSSANNFIIAKN